MGIDACRADCRQADRGESQDEIFVYFVDQCRANMHLVLAFSPIGDDFRTRLRMFPSLVNCCAIDWFTEWPDEALRSVANHFLHDLELNEWQAPVVDLCVQMQMSVINLTSRFLAEVQRNYYITPTSYLLLISSFKKLLTRKREEVSLQKSRYVIGLDKLKDLQPVLVVKSAEVEELIKKIAADTKDADVVKARVSKEEASAAGQEHAAMTMASECEADLAVAMPALEDAVKALKSLNKADIVEVKNLKNPPGGVRLTLGAVCVMLGYGPEMVKDDSGKKVADYWNVAKKELLGDPRLLDRLLKFDQDALTQETIDKLQPWMNDDAFAPEKIKKVSKACEGMCKWCRAMNTYYNVAKVVRPKQAALKKAEEDLAVVQAALAVTR